MVVTIRDSVHGFIDFNEEEKAVIDSVWMQRLRYIKHLGLTYLIYPSANHTRFEHSLGTAHLTKKVINYLGLDRGREVVLFALTHDVGHGPFSHVSEDALAQHGINHDKLWEQRVKEIEEEVGVDFSSVVKEWKKTGIFEIVRGGLGTDRLDYLLRDAKHTGVAYGVVEYDRLLRKMFMENGKVGIEYSALGVLESLFFARFLMFYHVYFHHTTIIANEMLKHAIKLLVEKCGQEPQHIMKMTDCELISTLKRCKYTQTLITQLLKRQLWKHVVIESLEDKEAWEEKGLKVVEIGSVVKRERIYVRKDGVIINFEKLSPFLRFLRQMEQRKARIMVIGPQNLIQQFKKEYKC